MRTPARIADALGTGRPFNIIHLASTAKFDIFSFAARPL